jgi:hypothetical protein
VKNLSLRISRLSYASSAVVNFIKLYPKRLSFCMGVSIYEIPRQRDNSRRDGGKMGKLSLTPNRAQAETITILDVDVGVWRKFSLALCPVMENFCWKHNKDILLDVWPCAKYIPLCILMPPQNPSSASHPIKRFNLSKDLCMATFMVPGGITKVTA